MYLKSITSLSKDEVAEYTAIYKRLEEKFGKPSSWRDTIFSELHHTQTPGTHKYTGIVKPFIPITELELAMVLDRGFSNFGGVVSLSPSGHFQVSIYFD